MRWGNVYTCMPFFIRQEPSLVVSSHHSFYIYVSSSCIVHVNKEFYYNVNALEHHMNKDISSSVRNNSFVQSGFSSSYIRDGCSCCHGIRTMACRTRIHFIIWCQNIPNEASLLFFFPPLLLILVELTGSNEGSLPFTMVGALPQKIHDVRWDYVWLSRSRASFALFRVLHFKPSPRPSHCRFPFLSWTLINCSEMCSHCICASLGGQKKSLGWGKPTLESQRCYKTSNSHVAELHVCSLFRLFCWI